MPNRKNIFAYAKKTFNAVPDYPFEKYPDYAVLRHADGVHALLDESCDLTK